jgi:polysaccharide transporter, PST family
MIEKLKIKIYNLLRWSQKYTKTDMVYLFKGGSILSLGKFLNIFIAFGMSIIWANFVPKEVYGQYKYLLSFVGIFSLFSLTGMGTSLTQSLSRKNNLNLINRVLKIKIKWSLIGTALGLILSSYYFFIESNSTLALTFLLISVFHVFINNFTIYQSILVGQRKFDALIKANILTHLISTISIVITIFLTKSLIILLFVYLVINSLLQIKIFFYVKNKYTNKTEKDKKEEQEVIKYGKQLSALGILSNAANYLDSLIIFNFISPVSLAIYTFAKALPDQFKGLMKNMHSLIVPKISNNDPKDIKSGLNKKISYLMIIGFMVFLLYFIFTPLIFNTFYPKYTESIKYTQLIALGFVVLPARVYLDSIFNAHRLKKSQNFRTIFTNIFFIVTLLILTPLWGIYGVITSKLISYYLSFFFSFFFLKKELVIKG